LPQLDTGGITPLHLAAQHGHVAATWLLIKDEGLPVDGHWNDDTLEQSGNNSRKVCTPLHRAAFSGAIATMKLLLEKRANLLARDESFGDQRTPLHKAAAGGRYLAVALLIDALQEQNLLCNGLSALDRDGLSPLQIAQHYQRIQEEERQSVSRWDVVAGCVADWDKCASLLLEAAREVDGSDPTKNKKRNDLPSATKTSSKLSSKLTRHRFAEVDCLDCEQNGECVTATWSEAFQKAMLQSVSTMTTTTTNQKESNHPPMDDNTATETAMEMEEPSSSSNAGSIPPLVSENKLNYPALLPPSSAGRACEACGKSTIVLFPSGENKGTLVCKKCRPKSRRIVTLKHA